MVIAAIGTVLAAGYLLWLYQRTAMGNPSPEFESHGAAGPFAECRCQPRPR